MYPFGEDNAPPVLGAYTLEGLALAVDPSSQRLVPANLIMFERAGGIRKTCENSRPPCRPRLDSLYAVQGQRLGFKRVQVQPP